MTYFIKNYDKKKLLKKIKELDLEYKIVIDEISKEYKIDFRRLNSVKNYQNAAKALGIESKKRKNELIKLLGWDSKVKVFIAKIGLTQLLH